MAERGARIPGRPPVQRMPRLGQHELQTEKLADAFVEGVFEMHDASKSAERDGNEPCAGRRSG